MTGLLVAVIVKLLFGEADSVYFISQLAAFAVAAMRLMPSVGRINEHASNMLYALPSVALVYHDLVGIEGRTKSFRHFSNESPDLGNRSSYASCNLPFLLFIH